MSTHRVRILVVLAVIVIALILIATNSSSNSKPPTTTPTGTVPAHVSAPASSTQVPNFGANGPSGVATSPQDSHLTSAQKQALALANAETQGVDSQNADPLQRAKETAAKASHPLYQLLPLSKGDVTLELGDFGDTQHPGISVVYLGSRAHARSVVAHFFARSHDQESRYQIQYNAG